MPPCRRRFLQQALAASALLPGLVHAQARTPLPPVTVWKDPSCGCCKDWIAHMEAAGFAVKAIDESPNAARARLKVPRALGSCHTAEVGGYAIEGHVPAADVKRLLRERPAQAVGLSVPGMVVGSPGMDGPVYQGRKQPYEVLLITADGRTRVFAKYG